MRTSLRYQVTREEEYDYRSGRTVDRIKYRSFELNVTGCKSPEEHDEVISSFYNFLEERKIESQLIGDGTWEESVRLNDESIYSYLYIPVEDTEDKDYIKGLYKEWKKSI